MTFFETPEFWIAFAFVLVVLVAARPLMRALNAWGEKKAQAIQNQIEEAQKLADQAKKLKEQYEAAYARRSAERQKLMREAETEIRFLETEILDQSSDRVQRKNQEVEMRLKMIAEHGRQDVKQRMLSRVIRKTEQLLTEQLGHQSKNENQDDLVENTCRALDSFESALNKRSF
ncbi:MAG: hypothetical protein IKS41_00845 [Alphaproteobacteria bacterium]|nr:hypothetical protein [Alphaproteobacteria bacterium]